MEKQKEICDTNNHEYIEEDYGYRCKKCDSFIPFGCEPWIDENYDDFEERGLIKCSLCDCIIGDEVAYGGEGISPNEEYCERCYNIDQEIEKRNA